jgi:nucleoside deoxyribosyltransferase
MKTVYLAGPFFDDEQIDRAERLEKALTSNPTVSSFFSPRQHQYEEYEEFTPEWAEVVFKSDRDALANADVVVAMLDFFGDDDVDPGTAWEIGFAGAVNKPVILVKEKAGKVNIMMTVPGHYFVSDAAEIATYDFDKMPENDWQGGLF